jgi:hypothetical protein
MDRHESAVGTEAVAERRGRALSKPPTMPPRLGRDVRADSGTTAVAKLSVGPDRFVRSAGWSRSPARPAGRAGAIGCCG